MGSTPLLGVDIGTSAVKVVALPRRHSPRWSVVPLPDGVVSEKQVQQPEAVATALRTALGELGRPPRRAALAVGGAAVMTREWRLPANLEEEELEARVREEAASALPFDPASVYLDFQVLGPDPDDAGLCQVLLAASRADQVDGRLAAAREAGLRPLLVDLESFALEQSAAAMAGEGEAVAVADIGATSMTLALAGGGGHHFSRSQALSGTPLATALSSARGMTRVEAENALRQGEVPADDLVTPFVEAVAAQLNRLLPLAADQAGRGADRLLLAGGGALTPGIAAALRDALDLPVALARPLSRKGDEAPAGLRGMEPALAVAAALGRRRPL
ncbi:type IV pilus assembly protein PilM [Thiohalospira halophila DSM 15071]|uniref:Type IV pilus assembly protein PilM n=1 Tax=Thiohalospira halophila DSM 15071 TaxID=1123397 RepID=A0A1I1TCE7_9GAMM|nr:type IV pilus assembly protein PilM [Thiohalospira halophila]SFD56307.1 type IV pilus assembly protein PilM [Thiohalospira halophila DSM 15071]